VTQSLMPNPVDHPRHPRARQRHHEPRLRLRIKNANPLIEDDVCGRRQRRYQGNGAAASKGAHRDTDLGRVGPG